MEKKDAGSEEQKKIDTTIAPQLFDSFKKAF